MKEFKKLFFDLKKHMMTGVSYMIPFVVAGGILLALSVLFSGNASVPSDGVLKDIADIGIAGLGMMVPILSGFIAFSMADRPGIAPGVIGGIVANQIGAGFLGGMISGILAGFVVYYLKKIVVPTVLRSLMPIFIIPLVGTIIVGGTMMWVIGVPISNLMVWLTNWLTEMGTTNLAILGLIVGAMIAFDMGGPVNKVAFGFGSAMVGTIDPVTGMPSITALTIMAGIGVAICVPPLGMAIATFAAPQKFTIEERESGKAAIVMGLVGITEGAIPFAANDPLRVIPSNMVGAAIGAAVAMYFGAGNPAPWGGWIVLPVATQPLFYILGTVVGSAVTATMTIALKKKVQVQIENIEESSEFEFEFENI